MAKSEDTEKETWGTWEELLLTCAVSRHGTKSWDSVAMEIQNRSSFNLLTAQNCKQKYHDLKRRFMAKDDKIDEGEEESETDDKIDRIPWLDELRKLRVAELRSEVQQYDISIVSLQSKVKRLKEERERSLREDSNEEKPDLEKDEAKDDKKERDKEPKKSSPVSVAEKPVSGDDSDRENQSFNESNSTDPKGENRRTSVEESEKKPEPVEFADGKPDPVSGDSKPINEGSYIGSSDTIAKDSAAPPVRKSSKANPVGEGGESPELWESVAESKGGGDEGTKESSDVQSSASLSKKRRRSKIVSGSSSGEEHETDEVSPAIKRISVKSQPLISFLEIIRSHKYGSLFERRLESQETVKYRNLIRQHVDLETVRTRLEEGRYSGSSRRFFCDLLLLFNNAIVFFRKNSVESVAATELRELVSREMASRRRKPDRSPEEPTPSPPPVPSPPKPDPEPEPEPSGSLLVNQKPSVPMIAVRKRSSITAKASSLGVQRKGAVIEEKPVLERRQIDNSSPIVEEKEKEKEKSITKKRTKERSTSGARSSRTSSKSRTNTHMNSNVNSSQNPSPNSNSGSAGKGGAPDNNNSEPKTEKNNNNTTSAIAKKRSAANFLNRMKRNSLSDGTLLETLKSSVNNSNNGKAGGSEQKKSGGSGRGDGRKEQVSRQSSGGKQVQSSPAKRSVGRPPKKTAGPPPPLRPPAPAKRIRETTETEALATRQPRKRSRR
ncbi:hypothetical protein HHK36_017424 [Tetracentron sinense]|uniref:Uncharacterized protein n=1 Tax=Tetracentron sinense TaxID=13715 RepID=A0A834Z1A8_TETSI|nr:hypothetical protein HHK36_017424 [Tetracentron sinense]